MVLLHRGCSITSSTASKLRGSTTSQCNTTSHSQQTSSPNRLTSRRLNSQSAINLNHLSRNVTGIVGEKKGGDPCHLVRLCKASERDLFANLFLIAFVQLAGHIGGDHPQCERVHGDFSTRHFFSKRFCQTDHAGLRCRVVRLSRHSDFAADR